MNSDFLRKTGVPGANNVVPQLHAGFVMLENLFLCLYFIIVIVKGVKIKFLLDCIERTHVYVALNQI